MMAQPWGYMTFVDFLATYSMTALDVLIMTVGVVLLYVTDKYIYAGTTIFAVMDEQNFLVRVGVIYAELLAIMLVGMVGSSAFITCCEQIVPAAAGLFHAL